MFPIRPSPVIPKFDATRPPPPLPPHLQNNTGSSTSNIRKRTLEFCSEAAPSKCRRIAGSETRGICRNSMQLKLSGGLQNERIPKLQCDLERANIILSQKMMDTEILNFLMNENVNSELFPLMEKFLFQEQPSTVQTNDTTDTLGISSKTLGVIITQLLDIILCNTSKRTVRDSDRFPFHSVDETMLHQGSSFRRSNNSSTCSVDYVNALLGMIFTSKEEMLQSETSRASSSRTSNVNGLSTYGAGAQKSASPQSNTTRPPNAAPTSRYFPGPGVAGPSGLGRGSVASQPAPGGLSTSRPVGMYSGSGIVGPTEVPGAGIPTSGVVHRSGIPSASHGPVVTNVAGNYGPGIPGPSGTSAVSNYEVPGPCRMPSAASPTYPVYHPAIPPPPPHAARAAYQYPAAVGSASSGGAVSAPPPPPAQPAPPAPPLTWHSASFNTLQPQQPFNTPHTYMPYDMGRYPPHQYYPQKGC